MFFYPKDNSPVCSAEACSFRDSYEVFRDAGAEVIGVSADSSQSHKRFAARFRLPFVLLSDKGGVVRKRYGVAKTLGVFPGRTHFSSIGRELFATFSRRSSCQPSMYRKRCPF